MTYTPKEYISAYIKASGLFIPTPLVWRPFGELLEIDRCVVDGRLVTNSQSSIQRHLGHRLHNPVVLSLFEMVLIWLRIIR